MSKKTVAELLVETLAGVGVERIYGVAGDSLNGITDSLRKRDDIQWIAVRHEEAAAFAAGASAVKGGYECPVNLDIPFPSDVGAQARERRREE